MLDLQELEGEAERLSNTKGTSGDFLDNFVKMPDKNGYIVLRILPPAKASLFATAENPNPEKPRLYAATRIHRVAGKSLHCPRVLQGEGKKKHWVGDCPICSMYSWLWKESEKHPKDSDAAKTLQKQARDIKPTQKYYYNVIVRQVKDQDKALVNKEDEGVKIWSTGVQIHSMIIRAILGDKDIGEAPLGDITDVTGKFGRDFKIIKTLKTSPDGIFPCYEGSKFMDISPLGNPEQIEKWTNSMHNLSTLRNVKPLEVLEHELKVHNGVIKADEKQGSFDPQQYMKSNNAASPTVTVVTKPVVAAPVHQAPPVESGDPLVEESFMRELIEAAGN